MAEDLLLSYIWEYGFDKLREEYSIKIVRHRKYSNLVLVKYDQINTPKNDLTAMCRGSIIDELTNKYVCKTYSRFFNYGEGHAAEIDWSTACVQEKLDGSLMQMFWHNGDWHIATSGTPDASGEVSGFNFTFAELFWRTWNDLNYKLPEDTSFCYAFELMTPYNRVVVPHKTSRIVLHGLRDLRTLQEHAPSASFGWDVVKSFPLTSWDAVIKASQELNAMEAEGFVVVGGKFSRAKLKSTTYTALAHLKDGMSARRMLEIVRNGESEEILAYFPEFKPLYHLVKERYDGLVSNTEQAWQQYSHLTDQKEFALAIKDLPDVASSILFAIKKGRFVSVKEGLKEMLLPTLERLAKLEEIKFEPTGDVANDL